jgi:hypothetical protein
MKNSIIPSTWIIWSLTHGGSTFWCGGCDAKMFVRYESGLCPLCWNGRTPGHHPEPVIPVPPERALAGVLDDPAVEA